MGFEKKQKSNRGNRILYSLNNTKLCFNLVFMHFPFPGKGKKGGHKVFKIINNSFFVKNSQYCALCRLLYDFLWGTKGFE